MSGGLVGLVRGLRWLALWRGWIGGSDGRSDEEQA